MCPRARTSLHVLPSSRAIPQKKPASTGGWKTSCAAHHTINTSSRAYKNTSRIGFSKPTRATQKYGLRGYYTCSFLCHQQHVYCAANTCVMATRIATPLTPAATTFFSNTRINTTNAGAKKPARMAHIRAVRPQSVVSV